MMMMIILDNGDNPLFVLVKNMRVSAPPFLLRYRRVPTEAPELTDDVKKDLIQDSNQLQEAEAR